MKRPQPDIGEVLQGQFIQTMGGARKFKRLWGTTTVGGVEVLHNRRYYYPASSRPVNFEKLFKYLGAYEDVTGSIKGVSSAWIYLNKNKESKLPELEGSILEGTKDFVSYNLNKLWWNDNDGPRPEGLTLTTSVTIGSKFMPTGSSVLADLALPVSTELLAPNMSQSQLITSITNNFDTLWSTCTISQEGVGVINKGSITDPINNITTPDEDDLTPDDPWLNTLARYALRSDGIPCTIREVSVGKGRRQDGRIYNTYVITLEIPYIAFTPSSPIVGLIATDIQEEESNDIYFDNAARPNSVWTRRELQQMDSTDLDNDPDLISRSYRLWEDVGATNFNSIWHVHNGKQYIKADAFYNPGDYGLKYKELYEYVTSLIDTGYKKKKVKWYKKALAIIVAVIVFVVSGGNVGAAFATFTAFATFVVIISLILTILSLVTAVLGMESAASAFAAANKTIEPLVILASIFLFVDGITQKLKEQAAKKGAEKITSEVVLDFLEESLENLVEDFIDTILQGYSDVMSGQLTNAAIQFVNNTLKLLTLPQQIKLEKIADRNKDLRAEYEKLQEELSQEDDLLRGFARIYARPATADWSYYAQQFDQPYERGGGRLHIGNIQRTTKQALRKADYSDPAFDNILVV